MIKLLETLSDFRCHRFTFEGMESIIVLPDAEPNGKWALKTEYWHAFPDMEIMLLQKGYHVAYVTNETRFATDADCDRKARFVRYISTEYGLSSKCIPIGMSCGGAHAVRFAGLHPECVSCVYIDAPVLNYCSYPGKIGDEECERVWEREFVIAYPDIKRSDLLNFPRHPLNCSQTIIDNNIPILMVYGTEDTDVIYEENGALLEDAFSHTDLLTTIRIEGRGHHPHGMIGDDAPIVEYIDTNS